MSIKIAIVTDFVGTGLKKATAEFKQLEGAGKKTGFLIKKSMVPATAALGAFAGFMVHAAKGAEEARIANDKLGAVLDTMGFGEATDRVSAYAESLEKTIAVDADVIKATQTKLATFNQLTKSVGKAGGAFDRATKAALDMAAAGFGTAEGNAVQLGKALQDPIKGLASLAKSGVTFTQVEKDKIAALVESGKLLEAQDLVLKAIEGQVAGTAEASASSFDKMKFAIAGVSDTFGSLRAFRKIVDAVFGAIKFYINNVTIPAVQAMVSVFKTAFNAIAAIWNNTVGKLSFKVPDWVPKLGGKGFSVPKIPMLAAGGIVTARRLP
jgi:phage-related minor tail protein